MNHSSEGGFSDMAIRWCVTTRVDGLQQDQIYTRSVVVETLSGQPEVAAVPQEDGIVEGTTFTQRTVHFLRIDRNL